LGKSAKGKNEYITDKLKCKVKMELILLAPFSQHHRTEAQQ
jgi:hypothetical protein